ncbi:MAG: LacI family DNA-binding transcriptional regulator [Tranquillimonas sp.]
MRSKAPRIQDVAEAAGVSTATVSRALSDPERVSEATRRTVLAAVERTGYSANRAARMLRTRRAGAVLVLVPNLGNPFFSQILSGIEAVFAAAGTSVLIADTQEQPIGPGQIARYISGGHADGLISLDGAIAPETLADEAQLPEGAPLVFACEWSAAGRFPSIRSDNADGVAQAVDHLVGLGHRRIGMVGGPDGNVLSAAREGAFRDALARHGIAPRDDWFVPGDFSLEAGRQAARRLLEMTDRPTAVFCAADQMALGLIGELRSRGASVPEELSVVGFDDIEIAEHVWPGLTTIRQRRHDLGRRAAEILLARLAAPEPARAETTILPVALVVRGSTGPAPGGR